MAPDDMDANERSSCEDYGPIISGLVGGVSGGVDGYLERYVDIRTPSYTSGQTILIAPKGASNPSLKAYSN